jgi:lipoprotein-anchoring transpeptidase ErfK/SrfK
MVGKLHRWFAWTAGCIAVTNKEMDEFYQKVRIGTSIEIKL